MSYKRSKYFLTPEKRKINYLLANKNSKITVVFFMVLCLICLEKSHQHYKGFVEN